MNNTYGNVKSAVIDIEHDVDIFYQYRPTLNSEDINFKDFKKIKEPSSLLKETFIDKESFNNNNEHYDDPKLPGMYNLSLPVSIFGRKGFYTIYIKPKEIYCTIKDIGVLAAFPDIVGIVLDMNEIHSERALFGNDNLIGYRVEYLEYNNKLQRQDYYRLITSCSYAEPVTQNLATSNSASNGYRFNDNGSLCFMTVTPSTTANFQTSSKPYIGVPNQRIILTNTKFDPVCVRVEICENDFDTLATSIDGNQIRSLDNGILTTYNKDNEIFKQFEFYTLKDNYNKNTKLEVKKQRTDNIDNSVNQDEIFNV